MITRRTFAGLAISSVALASVARPARAETVLHMGDQRGNLHALMDAAGVLHDLPYRLEWSEFVSAAPLAEAMAAEAVDSGVIGDAPFTFAFAAGARIRAIATRKSTQEGTAVIVTKDSPAKTFTDLRGKRVATGRGSIGHFLVLMALQKNGMTTSDIKLVFLLPADARAALESGAIDAWSTWEPYTSQAEIMNGMRRVISGAGLTPGQGFQAATVSAIATKHAELEDFIRRLARARAWANANIDAYAASWGKLMGFPESIPRHWFTRDREKIVPTDAQVIAGEQLVIDTYFKAGLLQKSFDAATAFDQSFNDAIRKGVAEAGG